MKHRLDLVPEIDLYACHVRARVAEIEPAGEVRLDTPRGRQLWPRRYDHIAAKIGALVERLLGEVVNLLADIATADQATDGAADAADNLAGGAGDLGGRRGGG